MCKLLGAPSQLSPRITHNRRKFARLGIWKHVWLDARSLATNYPRSGSTFEATPISDGASRSAAMAVAGVIALESGSRNSPSPKPSIVNSILVHRISDIFVWGSYTSSELG